MNARPLADTFVLASTFTDEKDGSTAEHIYITYNGQTIGGELYSPPRQNRHMVAWLNANKEALGKALGVPPFNFARDR